MLLQSDKGIVKLFDMINNKLTKAKISSPTTNEAPHLSLLTAYNPSQFLQGKNIG